MTYTSKEAREYLDGLPVKDRKLPAAFKKKWVTALRSGKYKRGIGELCKMEEQQDGTIKVGYCCLGVAGKVLGNSNEKLDAAFLDESHGKKQKVPNILIGANPVTKYLADLNDEPKRKVGFKAIANWIERNL